MFNSLQLLANLGRGAPRRGHTLAFGMVSGVEIFQGVAEAFLAPAGAGKRPLPLRGWREEDLRHASSRSDEV